LNAPDRRVPAQEPLLVWSNDRLQDYGRVQQRGPVIEESVTQLGTGSYAARAAIVAAGDVVLFRAQQPDVRSVGVTMLDPAYVAFAIPESWEGEYVLNGHAASASSIYLPAAGGTF